MPRGAAVRWVQGVAVCSGHCNVLGWSRGVLRWSRGVLGRLQCAWGGAGQFGHPGAPVLRLFLPQGSETLLPDPPPRLGIGVRGTGTGRTGTDRQTPGPAAEGGGGYSQPALCERLRHRLPRDMQEAERQEYKSLSLAAVPGAGCPPPAHAIHPLPPAPPQPFGDGRWEMPERFCREPARTARARPAPGLGATTGPTEPHSHPTEPPHGVR